MARYLRILLFFTISFAVFSSAAFAQGGGYGKGKGKNKQSTVVFTSRDRDIIRDYFHDRNSNLPPGLAKRGGDLPPGLQKHLRKNGTLPPGLQKRLTPFPRDLEIRLPRLPDIYRRGMIGDSVVIVNRRTQRIIDVINDILRP